MTFFALVLNRPIVLICARNASSPSATICSGVLMRLNKSRVAMLTLTSVAWADSTTRKGSATIELTHGRNVTA